MNAAGSKANEFADFLKTQIDRNAGTADTLSASLKDMLGNGNQEQLDELLAAINGAPNGQAGIDALTALGEKREGWMAEDRAKLDGVMTGAGDRLDSLLTSLGPAKQYGEADVNNLAADIYGKKVGAVDRSVKLAGSQGFADALTKGLADSSQAADTRDAVARRFADTYSGLEADSRAQATSQVGQLSDLQTKQRSAAISELTNVLNPELQARVATYRPDTTAQTAAAAEARFGQDDLDRLERTRKALASEGQGKIASLIAGLNGANNQATNAASTLATNSSQAYADALKALGANQNSMVNALAPAAGGAIGAITASTLPSIIKALPAGLSGVASVLTQWLNGGGGEITPQVAQAIQVAQEAFRASELGSGAADDAFNIAASDWQLPDDWFAGWGNGLFGG